MLFRNSRFSAGDNRFICTSLRCRTCRVPGETEEGLFCDPALAVFATHFYCLLRQWDIDSNRTVPKLQPEQLWELLIRVRQFVSSCRHDLLVSLVG